MPSLIHAARGALAVCLSLFVAVVCVAADSDEWLPATSSRAIYGDQESDRRLVIGSVTNAPKYNFGQMKRLSLYMLDQLRDFGVDAVMVVTIDSHEKMIELLREGHVDWVSATPYSALMYEREANAELVLAKKSRGRGAYRSVFFSRSDANIKSLEDLKGKTIAFEKPGSTSAYFLPAMELIGAGLTLVQLQSPRDRAPENAIGYVFSGDEVNSSTWVHKRITDAAAFSNGDWESSWATPRGFLPDLEIFHQTEEVPRSLEVLRPGLDPLLHSRLVDSLLALNNAEDADEILSGYYGASDFSRLSAAQREALKRIRVSMKTFDASIRQTRESAVAVPGS